MSIFFDSTFCPTELCIIGGSNNTDKSPFSLNSVCCQHRKGYTAFYSLILSQYRFKDNVNILELGIEQGSSLRTWSEWFSKANIYSIEVSDEKIQKCKNMNIDRVKYYKSDVSTANFLECIENDVQFDIIIDDSSHEIDHQNNIIEEAHKRLVSGGILVIEDIHRSIDMTNFKINSGDWAFYTFVICNHKNQFHSDNDKILFMVKK